MSNFDVFKVRTKCSFGIVYKYCTYESTNICWDHWMLWFCRTRRLSTRTETVNSAKPGCKKIKRQWPMRKLSSLLTNTTLLETEWYASIFSNVYLHFTNSWLFFMRRSCAQFDYAEFLKLLESHILMSNFETFKVHVHFKCYFDVFTSIFWNYRQTGSFLRGDVGWGLTHTRLSGPIKP